MTIRIDHQGDELHISTPVYQLKFLPDRLLAVLSHAGGMYYAMSLLSAADTTTQSDITQRQPVIEMVEQSPSRLLIKITSDSTIWENKTHFYELLPDRLDYWTVLQGQGQLDRLYFFQGRFPKTTLASIPGFHRIFHPLPNFLERQEFYAGQHIQFPAGGNDWVTQNIRGAALHGAPLCLVLEDDNADQSLSLGVLAKTGEYQFETVDFNYLDESLKKNPDYCIGTQALSLGYSGHLTVQGQWQSPRVTMRFATSRETALTQYITDLKQFGGMFQRSQPYQEWTRKPVFCTWHEQVAIGLREGLTTELASPSTLPPGGLFQYCTQANCEKWLAILQEQDIHIGSIIIDAMWQVHSGSPGVDPNKFPDMRGFIDQCHARNIRVMLWANAWDVAGVPNDECIMLNGEPRAADPTHPQYIKRLNAFVQHMLGDGPDCLNADGVKLDGMTNSPIGPDIHSHSGVSGFELARAMQQLWSDAIHNVKPQAVLSLYTAFPYFADLADVLRTGDLYTIKGDPISANAFRVAMMRYVLPDIAIDTDGAQRFNCLLPFDAIIDHQKQLGVPCLYQAQWLVQRRDFVLPVFTKLTDAHYQAMRQACQ